MGIIESPQKQRFDAFFSANEVDVSQMLWHSHMNVSGLFLGICGPIFVK
jgi:hypothetical protein